MIHNIWAMNKDKYVRLLNFYHEGKWISQEYLIPIHNTNVHIKEVNYIMKVNVISYLVV